MASMAASATGLSLPALASGANAVRPGLGIVLQIVGIVAMLGLVVAAAAG